MADDRSNTPESRIKNLEDIVQSMEAENAELRQQLASKEAELSRAEAIIRREQQIQDMGETIKREQELVQAKDRELAQAQQQLRQQAETIRRQQQQILDMKQQIKDMDQQIQDNMEQQIQDIEERTPLPHTATDNSSPLLVSPTHLHFPGQQIVPQSPTQQYTCQVSGPGLQSATVDKPTHVLVELRDSSGRPCSLQHNVTAELELISEAANALSSGNIVAVSSIPPCQYKVSYKPVQRGLHQLHVQVNDSKISGSPFTITVYPYPTQLGRPVRVVTELNRPYGIAVNSRGEIVISECDGHNISVFDEKGKSAKKFGSHGDSPEQVIKPAGLAIDDADNVYVSSEHKLQKFTKASSGEFELKKCIGQKGSGENDFDDPRGVTLYKNQLYVCDRNNDRIQVLNLDLNFVDTITSSGKGICEFNKPFDVQFDNDGNMYIAEYGNKRVQVMDNSGCYLREFGQERLKGPSAICIVDDRFVYVSDFNGHCIVVYETSGHFVTKFGKYGNMEGEFGTPYCITSCANGHIYVCDWANKRVQIF